VIEDLKKLISPKIFLISLLVIVVGVSVDMALVTPKSKRLVSLEKKRKELLGQVTQVQNSERENQRLLEYLEQYGLRTSSLIIEDPTAFLGKLIEDSKLVRLELKAVDEIESANLIQTKFFLRIHGPFDPTLHFIRTLESGTRLVTVDEIKINTGLDNRNLETRMTLSIYDPLEKP
jgi:hypothetical protein